MIIDSNANLTNSEFRDLRYIEDTVREAKNAGVFCCIEPCFLEGADVALELHHKYPEFVHPAVGLPGAEVKKVRWKERKALEAYAQLSSVVAIGEIGLDYTGSLFSQNRLSQKRWLRFQMKTAERCKLPVIIRSNAHHRVLALLKRYRGQGNGGIIRTDNLTVEDAIAYMRLGYHISIGSDILYETGEHIRELVRRIPLTRIILESGGHFAKPDWDVRGESESIFPKVIQRIAELKNVSKNVAEQVIAKNTIDLLKMTVIYKGWEA